MPAALLSLRIIARLSIIFICVLAAPRLAPADPAATSPAVIDVDAMAARMKTNQDIYRKIRDQGDAVFTKAHPKTAVDDQMKALIRISAYLWVWGDRYGEGLFHQADVYGVQVTGARVPDWLANMAIREESLQSSHSVAESDAEEVGFSVSQLLSTDYPAPFKMQAIVMMITNQIDFKNEEHGDPTAASFKMIPAGIKAWGEGFRQMIKDKWPHDLLDHAGTNLLSNSQNDQATLDLAIAEIDEDFNETDPDNPVKVALDGEYFVDAAWCARGSGWSNSVSDQGWKVFADRLTKADEILEAGYAKYPNEGEMARSMLNVELGQGQGRDRMELWFQRAIKADPDDYAAYKCKEWYLQPRWFGSIDDIVSFGQEAIKTDNWPARLPLIFTIGIAEASDQDPTLYSRDDIWPTAEKVYREYLTRYPNAIFYRTLFAKHACDGGHLDVAREQLKILGANWDHDAISTEDFAKMSQQLDSQ